MSPVGFGSTTVGAEMVQVQALAQIMDGLPSQLQRQADFWDPLDKSLAQKMGVAYKPIKLELPKNSFYYSGTRLGILGLPWSNFPAVSVMADAGGGTAEGGTITGGSHFSISLYIESIVRSDEFAFTDPNGVGDELVERVYQEGVVERRAKRMLDAIIHCIAANPTLDGLIPRLPEPRWTQTDAFMLSGSSPDDQSEGGGPHFKRVFSLIRIEYTPDVFALWPDANTPPSIPVLPTRFGA